MECEVWILVQVHGPLNTIEIKALLDSGVTGCFVDKVWVMRCKARSGECSTKWEHS